MLKFLVKGIIRDKSHSLFPVLTIAIGVAVTVLLVCWINGVAGDMLLTTAKFQTGHLKVVTKEYADNIDIMPIEYSLVNSTEIKKMLENDYPDYLWSERINFGGIIDIPDENGETKEQGFFVGKAFDIISSENFEVEMLNLNSALVKGRIPQNKNEILLSDRLFGKLKLSINSDLTLISNSMDGAMSMKNFQVVGTVLFGVEAIDRHMIIADLEGVRDLLYMEDCSAEILGFSKTEYFQQEEALEIQAQFNDEKYDESTSFSNYMLTLRDQQGLSDYIDMIDHFSGFFIIGFIFIMSIVLWNSGLMKGIRKYGEFGVRLAIGESKGHIFGTLILESLIIGVIGSIVGTLLGLLAALYLQEVGLSFGDVVKNSTIMISNTVHAKITVSAFYIGFIPGIFASVLGAMLAGRGIYKRETSQLFKELEK
jgi:putative ABC transport system permease protein